MTTLAIAIIAIAAAIALCHAIREDRREQETRRLFRRLYGGGG